jgi:glycolate oxidase FAD binding subunit
MSTEEQRQTILEARETREPLRITGGGSWMTAGRPSTASRGLSTARDRGIVDYVPDDLTITVRAGTPLHEIESVTGAKEQWLPLDPFGSREGTIGATMATGSSGPLAHSFGAARDFLLGVEFVSGNAEVIRGGGRVVKNVAGFDLMRLLCGSWGTLGVVTELTLRLYARPRRDRTFVLHSGDGAASSSRLKELREAPIAPIAMELVGESLARSLNLGARECVLIRIAGNDSLVEAQSRILGELGKRDEVGGEIWTKLLELDREAGVSLRVSGLPNDVPRIWDAARQFVASEAGGWMHSTFSRGVVRVVAKSADAKGLGDKLGSLTATGNAIFEVLPAASWRDLAPTAFSSGIARGIKQAFDPLNILNPGILGA